MKDKKIKWKIKTSIKIVITSFLFIYFSLLSKLFKKIIYVRFYSFLSGLFLFFAIFEITYLTVWSNFIKNGLKHNLITIRCKKCRNYFYSNRYESIDFCSNCIYLKLSKEKE